MSRHDEERRGTLVRWHIQWGYHITNRLIFSGAFLDAWAYDTILRTVMTRAFCDNSSDGILPDVSAAYQVSWVCVNQSVRVSFLNQYTFIGRKVWWRGRRLREELCSRNEGEGIQLFCSNSLTADRNATSLKRQCCRLKRTTGSID